MDRVRELVPVIDRARASFLGVALGDALGAPVEFMTALEISTQYGVVKDIHGGGWLHLKAGDVTDDTEMSLALGEAIVEKGAFETEAAARGLAAWMRARPTDVGNTVRRGLRRFILDGSLEAPPFSGDAGNGAVMRTLPVALATLADKTELERNSIAQAHITHHHALSDAATIHVGTLVHLGCLGAGVDRLLKESLEFVERFPAFAFRPYRGLSTGYVADTLATVLHGFFTTRSFEACLVTVVNRGGDADTNGAIAGAIAGAHYGLAGIPSRWLAKLRKATRVQVAEMAERLVLLSPLARGASS